MPTPRRAAATLLLLVPVLLLAACGDDDPLGPPAPPAEYVVEVSGEEFVVRVVTQAQVNDMEARMQAGVEGVINGALISGDGGFNEPWSWHLDPATVETPDVAIEVCDGRPSMVEEDLDYWLNTVERFCPWGALVVRRN